MQYDVLIVGGGPGGIYSAYELLEKRPDLKIALFEAGHALARRHCPIDGVKVKSCVKCPTCAIMNGFGGAGAFSDGKYNITNQFGGTLHEYIGKKQALELMEYVDEINVANGGEGTHLYSTGATPIKKLCLENDLHLLDASVRHLGTDKNLVVLEHLYNRLKDRMDIYFDTPVQSVERTDSGYQGQLRRALLRHLRGPQRQQVDGAGVPGAGHCHQVQPGRHRRPGGAAL